MNAMSTQPLEPVRLGVVGAGNFGSHHIHTLLGLAEAQLVAVVDAQQNRLNAIKQNHPHVGVWSDLSQALSQSDAQAWVIASSSASHVPVAQAILAAGLPVLIEKPLATTIEQGRQLSPLVKPDSSNLMMGHILLFNSEFRILRQQTQQRGNLRYIHAVRHRPIATKLLFPGESPLHLTMTHDLYVTQVLTNFEEPATFHASIHRDRDGRPVLAIAQLTWNTGVTASFTASFLTPEGMPDDGFDRLEVFGDGWAARTTPNPRPIDLWDDRHRTPLNLEILPDPLAPAGMLAEELRCFCRVVRGRQPVPPGARYADALQLLHWLDRLEQAAHAH